MTEPEGIPVLDPWDKAPGPEPQDPPIITGGPQPVIETAEEDPDDAV